MSAARIDKLKALLGRVQERTGAPRLRVAQAPAGVQVTPESIAARVPAAPAAPPAPERSVPPAAERVPSLPPERASKPPVPTPLEDAMAGLSRAEVLAPSAEVRAAAPTPVKAPPAVAAAEPARRKPSSELPGFEEPELPTSRPPAPGADDLESEGPATEPPITAATKRVDPRPSEPSDSVVRAVSAPRQDVARNFGELLELSLSLRPR